VTPRVVGVIPLRPLSGSASASAQAVAIVAQRGKEQDVIVQAKLPPTKQGQAYEVWLYNSRTNAVPVGAQVTDQNGNYQGAGKLPAPLSSYRFIDVSLQAIPAPACQRSPTCLRDSAKHSGNSVLRGSIASMQSPSQLGAGATGQQGVQPTGPTGATGP